MLLTIHVTQADIDHGNDQCGTCPVALGGNRALQQAGYGDLQVEFDPYTQGLTITDGLDREVTHLSLPYVPLKAINFASEFDDWYREERSCQGGEPLGSIYYQPPVPFSFIVNLPLEAPPCS